MSHRDDCPSRWEAERQGERAQEWGRSRSSNPYVSIWQDEGCPEAAEAWRSGYRRAEIREEEQREEDAARHRAEMRRAQLQAEEEDYYSRQMEDYYSRQMEAEQYPSEPFQEEPFPEEPQS